MTAPRERIKDAVVGFGEKYATALEKRDERAQAEAVERHITVMGELLYPTESCPKCRREIKATIGGWPACIATGADLGCGWQHPLCGPAERDRAWRDPLLQSDVGQEYEEHERNPE